MTITLLRSALALMTAGLLAASPLHAQCVGTNVSGTVVGAVWTPAGSPYCVTGDLRVANVTIQPGVVVQIDGSYKIEVLSALLAIGTEVDPIVFTSTTNDWDGLEFNNSPSNSWLQYCVIENADMPALSIVDSTPTLRNLTIQNNHTTTSGAALQASVGTGDLALKDCLIDGNTSTTSGGAVFAGMDNGFALVLEGCVFSNNVSNPAEAGGSYNGGAVRFQPTNGELIVIGSTFQQNQVNAFCAGFGCAARARGGAIYCVGGSATIVASSFHENRAKAIDASSFGNETADGRGGAIFFDHAAGSLALRNAAFTCNRSLQGGSITIADGAGVYVSSGQASVLNCDFIRNSDTVSGQEEDALFVASGATADVRNSVFYFNNQLTAGPDTYGVQIAGGGTIVVEYSDVQNGYAGVGNIALNPLVFDDGCGSMDLNLIPNPFGSPCIDAGDPDPQHDDVCFLPSLGSSRNDMGVTGGPGACPDAGPATVRSRNSGVNVASYTADPIVIGGTWNASLDLTTTGHTMGLVIAFASTLELTLAVGSVVLVNIADPSGELFALPAQPGPTASWSVPVPANPSLIGCTLYTQGIHYFGVAPYVLTNANDFLVGSF